ncbi:hypothetical protein [Phaeodactylibacter luteus]|uniref:hypothetical protein n=1 Tax=Phaeodactylibacter luteus TaxID=1564516 RepID=UPI0014782236|nr:hypothetical protein [Phaeodactylibacter luteus]
MPKKGKDSKKQDKKREVLEQLEPTPRRRKAAANKKPKYNHPQFWLNDEDN